MWSQVLFADTRDPLQSPEVIWGVVGLTIALLVGAGVIYAVDKWRKRLAATASDSDETNTLTSFRAMLESGEITEAEYAELRRRVAEKVKKPPTPNKDAPGPTATAPEARIAPADPPVLPATTPESSPPPSSA